MAIPDKFLTLTDATNLYGIDPGHLNRLIVSGKIKPAMINSTVIVSERDLMANTPRHVQPEYNWSLKGQRISASEASRKYHIPHQTISRWANKGYIAILARVGKFTYLDEADVDYCVTVYRANPGQGRWSFQSDGTPYQKK